MSIESMTSVRSIAQSTAVRAERMHGVTARSLSAGDLVGPIISERRAAIAVAPARLDVRTSRRGDVDLCRLLVAVLGVSVYLGAPAALLFYAALKLIG